MKKNKAFTMIELMSVLLIIGILIAVIAPRIRRGQAQAKIMATRTTLESLKTAVVFFKQDKGAYPQESDGLNSLVGSGVEESQLKDAWDNEFVYNAPPKKYKDRYKRFEIYSLGPDEEDSGDDLHDGD
ncbi:type II secretion system protein GspG [Candidatus Babeliales bacterium]|nr:type II secretion system protein GspG [Candidatus Babeliales bacterium]